MKTDIELASRYCAALDEIRSRLSVVDSICEGRLTTSQETLDYEIVAINLRKSLEHIAFGSLTANREAYGKAHKDIGKVWRAKELLDRLERIHEHFYPQPLKPPMVSNEVPRLLHFDRVTEDFLSRSDFVVLYDACSKVMHSANPFSNVVAIHFGQSPREWVARIRRLLGLHLFRLAGFPEVWIGELEGPDGKAHVAIAAPT